MSEAPHENGNRVRVALIGFGEAGAAFAEGLASEGGVAIRAFDIKTDDGDAAVREAKWADYAAGGVEGCASLAEALADAEIVFSLVTADRAQDAARAAAQHMPRDAFFLDCNSCSPETKRSSAGLIEPEGGRYVDTAIMAPVHPRLHRTPVRISGPHAEAVLAVLEGLGMSVTLQPGDVGAASSTKMVRSIVVKGLEALAVECILAGRKAGVEDIVLAALDETYPGFDWPKRGAYMLERVMVHGERRAAEMREVARTVESLGLDPGMSRATSAWQQRVGELHVPREKTESTDYRELADVILAALEESGS